GGHAWNRSGSRHRRSRLLWCRSLETSCAKMRGYTAMTKPVAVHTLLGDYPVTLALKKGEVKSSSVSLDFADVKTPSTAFKRVVRNLEFDCAELAIVTFLIAQTHGKPLVLLPAIALTRFP